MWYSKPIGEILKILNVDSSFGLPEADAKQRLKESGANKLIEKKKPGIIVMFFRQLNDWLIYVLLAAVVITLLLHEYADVTIITLVIIVNAVLGVIQEVKSDKAIAALRKLSYPKADVFRNGIATTIDSENLVPGDILILSAGQFIAADIRLIEAVNLQIDESALTGESVPSLKDASFVAEEQNTPVGDRINAAFMSTIVNSGRGIGLVINTGMNTEIGKVANIINTEDESKTPLEIKLNELGKILGKFALGICVIIFISLQFAFKTA